MTASEVASFETNFFRIAGTSEAETSVSGKAECLLAIGEDKKSKLSGMTFSFKYISKLIRKNMPARFSPGLSVGGLLGTSCQKKGGGEGVFY